MTRLTGRKKKNPIKKAPIKARDTMHVKTSAGHKIVVKKGSSYAKQAEKTGAVISSLRPRKSASSKSKDPLAVKNYNKRYKK